MENEYFMLAIRAALAAGNKIIKIYEETETEIEYKEDCSPLTLADLTSNKVINDHLLSTKIPIISEENQQLDFSIRKKWSKCWIVDPLDGTKEFIKRNGEFTVNIALVINGIPELGVIYAPAMKLMYMGNVSKNTAYKSILSSHNSSLKQVLDSAVKLQPKYNNKNTIQIACSRSHMNKNTLDFVETLKANHKHVELVQIGSSLKFCLVAEGDVDMYPRFAPTMEWDTAAGQAICNAVGIEVNSDETKQSLMYNKKNLLNPWFLVSKS